MANGDGALGLELDVIFIGEVLANGISSSERRFAGGIEPDLLWPPDSANGDNGLVFGANIEGSCFRRFGCCLSILFGFTLMSSDAFN